MGCRLDKALHWAIRMTHESQQHANCTPQAHFPDCKVDPHTGAFLHANSFVTLTYNDDSLPLDWSLNVTDWQNFAHRTRKTLGRFRFYQCGEYGGQTGRPHHHAILYGLNFSSDRIRWKKAAKQKNGTQNYLYRSETLQSLWGLGDTYIEDMNFKACAYVAGYITKRITGEKALDHYGLLKPEFATMSRNPGLGAAWFDKYKTDIYPRDEVVLNGKTSRPPKFYDSLLERSNPDLLERVIHSRAQSANSPKQLINNTPQRLRVREEIQIRKQAESQRNAFS